MSKYEILPFKLWHLKHLHLQEAQLVQHPRDYLGEVIEKSKYLEIDDFAYTGFDDGHVIACCGILPTDEGRGYAWAYLSQDIILPEYTMFVTRNCIKTLNKAHKMGIHRIETQVLTSFPLGHKWARALGFEREGTMKAWGWDKQDYDLYGRVRY